MFLSVLWGIRLSRARRLSCESPTSPLWQEYWVDTFFFKHNLPVILQVGGKERDVKGPFPLLEVDETVAFLTKELKIVIK